MVQEIEETAEQEIERTSQETAKAVAAELGGELASAEKKSRLYEEKCLELERINLGLKEELLETNDRILLKELGFCGGGFAAGVLLAILGAAVF